MPRTFEAREHLPVGPRPYPWQTQYRVLGRADTAEGARQFVLARYAAAPATVGSCTIATLQTPDGVPLPPPGGGYPGT